MFSIVTDLKSDDCFGNTSKLFEAINSDELKQKIEETLKNVESMFNKPPENDENNSENNTAKNNRK